MSNSEPMHIDKEKFEREGFLLVKNVLSKEEVERLRELSLHTLEEDKEKGSMFIHRVARNHLGCLTNIEEFKQLIISDKVTKIAGDLLGGEPCFFGDSVLEIGIGSRGFHKDTSERKDKNHPDWNEDYPILRIAFYLEDHKTHSGGLKVRVGSNSTVKTNKGKALIVPSEAGDAVVFCLRTSHAGNAVRLKVAPERSFHNSLEKRIPAFMRVPEEKERISLFLTYGLKSPALDRYLNFMFEHKVYQQRIDHSQYPQSLVDELNEKLEFIDIKKMYAERTLSI